MAAAAYAAVVSLMNNMEQIRNHPRLSTSFHNDQNKSLGEHLDFFLEYVETYSFHGGSSDEEAEDLERRIASAAHAAEDVIESRVVDQIQDGFAGEGPSLLVDLEKIIEEMSLIREVVAIAKVINGRSHYAQKLTISPPAANPYERRGSLRASMVLDDYVLDEIHDRLIQAKKDREIISIYGPTGSGKTTCARYIYTNRIIMSRFNSRAWANVSEDDNVRGTLLQLISCLGGSTRKLANAHESELGSKLREMLLGERYLIVLDDMFMGVWDRIRYFFTENKNGSRIIVTASIEDLASLISSKPIRMKPLNDDQTFELFRQMAFVEEICPANLELIGKLIVRYCFGYPLLVSAIGGLLRKSPMDEEYWWYIYKSLDSISERDESGVIKRTLMVCYDALPTCLKPCFLYMGVFRKDCDIRVSQVIKLWVAEGFIKPSEGHNLEEVGENFFLELIDRNLISISSRRSNGKPKTCRINEFSKDLCTSIAEKEKFYSYVKAVNTPQGMDNERRFVGHDGNAEKRTNPRVLHAALLARSLICESPAMVSFKSRLLKILVEVYSDSLEATFQQVNTRFLAYKSMNAPIEWIPSYELPSSISLMWNLQTLIMGKKIEKVVAPSEIWEMRQLRHIELYRVCLPDPPATDDKDDSILENLHTIETVLNLECNEEVSKRMPNVKKLRVFYDGLSGEYLFCLFTKLESLNCLFNEVPNRDEFLQNLKFPSSLKKLSLKDCELHWSDLSIIGSELPLLEVLKLKPQSVRGPRWDIADEVEFNRLKFLEIDSCYLIYWSANKSHFPVLEKLVLRRMDRLKEIPSGMRYIETLEEICVFESSVSSAISAARILEEYEKFVDAQLEVRVGFSKEEEMDEFKAKIKSDGIVTFGLQIQGM